MNMRRLKHASKQTAPKGYVLLGMVVAVLVLPHFWTAVCAPAIYWFAR